MTPSKILFYFCISFVGGIFLESVIKIPQVFLWVFLLIVPGIIVFSGITKRDKFIVVGFCLLFLVFGILRMQISEFSIIKDKLSKLNDKQVLTINGIIFREPDVRDNHQKLKVKVDNSTILVTTSKYPEYQYLDQIQLTGKLETPIESEDGVPSGSYKNYLLKDGIYSVMGFPKIEVLNRGPSSIFSFFYSGILWSKQKIRVSIQRNFSPPYSSILEGTILGDNGAMTNDLKNKLNITGLRHIIAVSGTHVVILSSIIMSFLLFMGFWRSQAFYIAIVFICIYIILTGLPASGIRAGIMGGLFLLAQKLGRQTMGSRAIAIACAIMLSINPLLLFYDVGFQLSFLAIMGLVYLEPFIKMFIKFLLKTILRRQVKAENFVTIVSTTFAAQIFTLPIMVYNFGNISFVSPITNLLILPVVYWLMVFGFLFSFVSVFSSVLGSILSVPCWFLLTYFVVVIDLFSKPWAIKTIQNVHWIWLVVFYFLIGFAYRFINKKYSQKFV
jgi:competence protein ComEC